MKSVLEIVELPWIDPIHTLNGLTNQSHTFFLDSGFGGRYSIIAWNPTRIVKENSAKRLFSLLKKETPWAKIQDPRLPFVGGWIGYLGYELYDHLKKIPKPAGDDIGIPNSFLAFCDTVITFDHKERRVYLSLIGSDSLAMRKIRDGWRRGVLFDLHRSPLAEPGRGAEAKSTPRQTGPVANFSKGGYLRAVEKIKDYISAGDCYQVNLSQRFKVNSHEPPIETYQRLREISPAPYSAFIKAGDFSVLSSSPECFLEIRDNVVTTRPIKGTRPRSKNPCEDKKLRAELEKSAKDHAELLMITDLERSDLGRVCKKGTVKVPSLVTIESYSNVHHLVSTVKGELDRNKDAIDCIAATFPGGSITGAPKLRAMEIIRELETVPRKVYTGSVGFIGVNGDAHLNIAIRTMTIKGSAAYFHAGGGIVADSDPEAEYEETLTKANGMIKTLTL